MRLLHQPARTADDLLRISAHPAWRVLHRKLAEGDTLDTVHEGGAELLVVCSGDDAAQAWLRSVPADERPEARVLVVTSDVLFRETQKVPGVSGLIFDPMGPGPTVRQPLTVAADLLAAAAR